MKINKLVILIMMILVLCSGVYAADEASIKTIKYVDSPNLQPNHFWISYYDNDGKLSTHTISDEIGEIPNSPFVFKVSGEGTNSQKVIISESGEKIIETNFFPKGTWGDDSNIYYSAQTSEVPAGNTLPDGTTVTREQSIDAARVATAAQADADEMAAAKEDVADSVAEAPAADVISKPILIAEAKTGPIITYEQFGSVGGNEVVYTYSQEKEKGKKTLTQLSVSTYESEEADAPKTITYNVLKLSPDKKEMLIQTSDQKKTNEAYLIQDVKLFTLDKEKSIFGDNRMWVATLDGDTGKVLSYKRATEEERDAYFTKLATVERQVSINKYNEARDSYSSGLSDFKNLFTQDGAKETNTKTDRVAYDIMIGAQYARSTDSLSGLFMSEDDLASWRGPVDEVFSYLEPAGWAAAMCEKKIDSPPAGTSYIKLPQGQGISVSASIAGECSKQTSLFRDETDYLYKFVGFVKNPQLHEDDSDVEFQITVSGPSGTANLLTSKKKLAPGETFSMQARDSFAQISSNEYDTICVNFDNPPDHYKDNTVCNTIKCIDVNSTGYTQPTIVIPPVVTPTEPPTGDASGEPSGTPTGRFNII